MPRERIVPVYEINISADPHPSEIYINILSQAARIIANARGSDYARLTIPKQNRLNDSLYSGSIHIWTDIDMEGDWVNLDKQEKLTADERKNIQIPDNARPNFRVFEYAFNKKSHRMFVEGKNDFDKTLAPNTMFSILQTVLTAEALGPDFPEVSVTLIPIPGAAKELLAVPAIRTVHIKVYRPNPEFASAEATARVYKRMDDMKVHIIEEKLTRNASADSMELKGASLDLAEVSVDNGELRVQGRDAQDKKVDLSSKDKPRRYDVPIPRNESFLASILEFIPGIR